MSCENLVCAACSGRVSEGGCPTCRVSRLEVHRHGGELPAAAILWLCLLMTLVAVGLTAR